MTVAEIQAWVQVAVIAGVALTGRVIWRCLIRWRREN